MNLSIFVFTVNRIPLTDYKLVTLLFHLSGMCTALATLFKAGKISAVAWLPWSMRHQ